MMNSGSTNKKAMIATKKSNTRFKKNLYIFASVKQRADAAGFTNKDNFLIPGNCLFILQAIHYN